MTTMPSRSIHNLTLTDPAMYLVAIAWMYVVVMMTVVEATSANGSILGAIFTFVLYGALPLSVVLYIMRSPGRKRARLAADALAVVAPAAETSMTQPDCCDHAPGDAITAERKES
jgi:hypothetical protein